MKKTSHKQNLIRNGINLEYITLFWNVIGACIVFIAAINARSVALAGFGFDSVIEIFASLVVVWQLKSINKGKEILAEKLIGFAFFALAIYIVAQICISLASNTHPKDSMIGIVWLSFTTVSMLLLAYGKKQVGNKIPNIVLQKEANVTLIDAALAFSVLFGLVINLIFGIWYADLIAALVIVFYGIKEGVAALKVRL